jgi:protein required for attachment to host cells
MTKASLLVLVANGAHARVLRRAAGSSDLHTLLRIEDGPVRGEARAAPDPNRRRDERLHAFIAVLAAHLRELLRQHPSDGLVLAAPPRILAPLRADLAPTGAVRAATTKNLVRLDDREVVAHLADELRHAEGSFAD